MLITYHQKGGTKAVFTGMTGSTKEVISLAAVPSTALREVIHLLKQSKTRRETFDPSVVYTDTCPNGTYVWKGLFGNDIDCRLSLFHFVHQLWKHWITKVSCTGNASLSSNIAFIRTMTVIILT